MVQLLYFIYKTSAIKIVSAKSFPESMNSLVMKLFSLIFLLTFTLIPLHSQGISAGIIESFEKGDAKALSKYMNKNIEVKILDKEHVTSRSQAMRMLQDFFKNHKPKSFTISHKGNNSEVKYGLGSLVTSDGTFKVNLYFLGGEDKHLIYYLSIEES